MQTFNETYYDYLIESSDNSGFIAVDLDGTLAEYTHWQGIEHIGKPIPKMINRIKNWLRQGKKVKIFTARAVSPKAVKIIQKWLIDNKLPKLEVTNIKEMGMRVFWDDRAISVHKNTGYRS